MFGDTASMESVADLLDANADASRVRLTPATRSGTAVVLATVHPRAVNSLMDQLRDAGVSDVDVTLTREDVLGRSRTPGAEAGLVWEDVLGMAGRNSRPVARYLAFMLAAGVIASYGVIEYNGILVVGAMAISPDLLPITAIGVGLVDGRLRFEPSPPRSPDAISAGAAAITAFLQDRFARIPPRFDIDATVLGGLTHVGNETIVVALAAGVAGMLALETRAGSGVGVAVSVTTIPAAAYLGVAVGLGEMAHAPGALAVLGVNVLMLVIASSCTLLLQRFVASRQLARRQQRTT